MDNDGFIWIIFVYINYTVVGRIAILAKMSSAALRGQRPRGMRRDSFAVVCRIARAAG
jgi:hypothetical protein